MNKDLSRFLQDVTEEIKYSKVHKSISEEIESHVEELKEEFIEEGLNEEEAYKRAVECMGNPNEIGKELNKAHKPRVEWSIFTLVSILIGIGLIGVLTYSSYYSQNVIQKQLVWVVIGMLALFGVYFIDYKRIEKYSLIGYIVTTVIMFLLMIISPTINGARGYIILGNIGFRISSLGMPFLIVFYVGIVKRYCTGTIKGILISLAIGVPSLVVLLIAPDTLRLMITGIVYGITIFSVIFSKGYEGSKKHGILTLSTIVVGAFGAVVLKVVSHPYYLNRLTSFMNPQDDPQGMGYLPLQLKELWNNAKFMGDSGALIINQNGQAHPAVPGLETDFMFTFISASLGKVVGILLIVVLVAVVLRLFLATRKLNDVYGKVICISVCTVFLMQVVINVLMNLGYFPISGSSLPFISYGGSDFLGNALFIGMFLGIYRRKDIIIA